MMRPVASLIVVLMFLALSPRPATAADDLSTQIVQCTFKLTNGKVNGTAFVLSRLVENASPQRILVTAAHAFEQMGGDEATLVARKLRADGTYEKFNVSVRLRQEGRQLWVRHPTQDAAVVPVSLPAELNVPELSADLLATDEMLKTYEIHPGDIIRCAGYPHAREFEANEAGFPVVRLGCIAGFPLLPTKVTRTFLFDFNTFEGDSGGAVYLDDTHRYYGGKAQEGRVRLILGLIHGQHFIDEQFTTVYQSGKTRHRMGLGIVVHASSIRETIEMLSRR